MNIILGAAIVLAVISFVLTIFKDIGLSMIFNVDAFMIVAGGTIISLFIGFPVSRIRDAVNDVNETFMKPRNRDDLVKDLLNLSRLHRRGDIRNLEESAQKLDDEHLKMGVNLLINGHEEQEIKNVMEREMMLRVVNYNFSQNLLKTVARLTPSFGLAGTVISLIRMFKHFESVETIAPMMAVALMSTFYGVIIANLFMMPLCAKLKERAVQVEAMMSLNIEGVLAIKNMDHPLEIEEKIRGYQAGEDEAIQLVHNVMPVPKGAGA